MSDRRTARALYDSFWKKLVETDGQLDLQKVANELADYKFLLDQVPKVYMHVTGGKLSKPNYPAAAVIACAEDAFAQRVQFAVMDAHEEWERGQQ
jgi:hypothetical protein